MNASIFAPEIKIKTCYAIHYISIQNGLVRKAITFAGRMFQRIEFINQDEYAGPAEMRGFFMTTD
jgi:hypothetical protein